jgi:hypothetical protein
MTSSIFSVAKTSSWSTAQFIFIYPRYVEVKVKQ